jgi:superfamily I DNA/RNA helicase
MTIHKAKGKEFDEVIVFEGMYQRYLQRQDAEGQRSGRFNLHVAATRARRAVTIMTPLANPCQLLPKAPEDYDFGSRSNHADTVQIHWQRLDRHVVPDRARGGRRHRGRFSGLSAGV